jgi:hypothetical protein
MGLAKMLSEEDGSKQSHQLENEKNSYCDLQIYQHRNQTYIYIFLCFILFLKKLKLKLKLKIYIYFLITKFIWGLLRGGNILMLV